VAARLKTLVMFFSFMILALAAVAQQSKLPECGDLQVSYSQFDVAYNKRILLTESKDSPPKSTLKTDEASVSPQNTRWYAIVEPDFMKKGPWSSELRIAGVGLYGHSPRIRFIDHGSGGVHAQWLNEKILFIQVWWGRIVSTDLVFDVEKRVFLYKEDANYGEMIQPCE
jgi:hypothetical protein